MKSVEIMMNKGVYGSSNQMSDDAREEEDRQLREKGVVCDLVLIFPIETDDKLQAALKVAKPKSENAFIRLLDDARRIETSDDIEADLKTLAARQKKRAEIILKLRRAGLTVRRSRDEEGQNVYVKVSATLKRLEKEAERSEIEMLLSPEAIERERDPVETSQFDKLLELGGFSKILKGFSELIFGADSQRVYRDYERDKKADFDRGGFKEGRLFSPLERSRLIYGIIEGAADQKGGGAELDLDMLVSDKVLGSYFTMHSSGQKYLEQEWGAMAQIGPIQSASVRLKANDFMCILLWVLLVIFYLIFATGAMSQPAYDTTMGVVLIVLVGVCALLGMFIQPLDLVRDYFGEKIAFYFGWMEHYSRYIFFLSAAAIIVVFTEAGGTTDASSYASLFYCLIVAIWTTLFQEGWKRKNAVLAHVWDVTDFEEEEDPRPEFLANFNRHPKWKNRDTHELSVRKFLDCLLLRGQMIKQRGFFTEDGRFIASQHPAAKWHRVFPPIYRFNVFLRSVPLLVFIGLVMMIGATSLLVFKMLIGVADNFSGNTFLSGSVGGMLPMILSTVWITTMNIFYRSVARAFNDLENYRTETEYNDALILKTVIFQFVNSYITLFYIAFLKSNAFPIGGLLGQIDPLTGEGYRDMCGQRPVWSSSWDDAQKARWADANVDPNCNIDTGDGCRFIFVQRDCFEDLRTLMVSYTLLRPCYELPLQIIGSIIAKFMGKMNYMKKMATNIGDTGVKEVELVVEGEGASGRSDEQKRATLHHNIALQKSQSAYGGTFEEYNPKVIQFGYIAMFSSAFPLAAVCTAVCNFIELRIDSYKLVSLARRPRYEGAEDIGSWQAVINTISWIALPVNVLILVFTSWDFRRLVVIPMVLGSKASCSSPQFNAADMNYVDAFGVAHPLAANLLVSPHAVFENRTTSYLGHCVENVNDCFAAIGSVPWLPAMEYLTNTSTYSLEFTDGGVCSSSSKLYNEFHCETCTAWKNEVFRTQLLLALILEHCLLLLKLLLDYIISDKPYWVLDAQARKKFGAEARVRASTVDGGDAAALARELGSEIEQLSKEINDEDHASSKEVSGGI